MGYKIDRDAAQLLAEGAGPDTLNLMNETYKLCLSSDPEKIIIAQSVRDICTLDLKSNIFMLFDCLFTNDRTNAVKITESLKNSGEAVQKIIISISNHLVRLFFVKDMTSKGLSTNDIANKLNNKPYYVSKLQKQAGSVTSDRLKKDIDLCYRADTGIKTGEIGEDEALDLIVLSL